MVNLTIDNQKVSVPEGTTILNAAKEVGIDIPIALPATNLALAVLLILMEIVSSMTK